VVERE
jgi:hypothetical protein